MARLFFVPFLVPTQVPTQVPSLTSTRVRPGDVSQVARA